MLLLWLVLLHHNVSCLNLLLGFVLLLCESLKVSQRLLGFHPSSLASSKDTCKVIGDLKFSWM